jgi:outer membrane protein OmpA-like peptidoglycan-associated protein
MRENQRMSVSLPHVAGVWLVSLLLPSPAAAASSAQPTPSVVGDLALKVEPGLAVPLSEPQSGAFNLGGSQTIKALVTVGPFVDVGPSVAFLALPNETSARSPGIAWSYGLGLRVKRPHETPDDDAYFSASPWVDADASYVRTGSLNRAGISAGAGLALPVGVARAFWLGPFVRYTQIFQTQSRSGYDNRDAKLLSVGISLEGGSGVRYRTPDVALCEPVACPHEGQVRTDSDGDGLPDDMDRCPQAMGPVDNWGCPAYKRLVIKPDKLELKERIYFAWDQSVLQEVSFPLLDEVVQALTDNKNFRVQVEGHTSSEGGDDHNQTLSEQRAAEVLDYLVVHGIARDRLDSKGFASSSPVDTNNTIAGRENNRRVEFVVQFNIITDGSK